MLIGAPDFDTAWEDPTRNIERITRLFARAQARGVELLVLPEMALSGFSMNPENAFEPRAIEFFSELIENSKVAVVFGHVEKYASGYYNCASFISPSFGPLTYAKRKLFTYAGEAKHYFPGKDALTFEFEGISISLNICYDLRFPELFRDNLPAELMIVIANWPTPRASHWYSLLRARAIENQCFVLGVNRTGSDRLKIDYTGAGSVLYDYNGDESKSLYWDSLLLWKIERKELEKLRAWRAAFPALNDI